MMYSRSNKIDLMKHSLLKYNILFLVEIIEIDNLIYLYAVET